MPSVVFLFGLNMIYFCTLFVHISAKFGVSRSNIPGGVAILVIFLKSQLRSQSAAQSPYKMKTVNEIK